MGSIIARKLDFIKQITATVAFKTGLNLTVEKLQDLLKDETEYIGYFSAPFDTDIRIDSVSYEELFALLLEKVGAAGQSDGFLLVTPYSIPYLETPISDKANLIGQQFISHVHEEMAEISAGRTDSSLGFGKFINRAFKENGILGRIIATDMVKRYYESSLRNPYSLERELEWKDIRELDDLFASENFTSLHGNYFDQRFINYLNQNFDEINKINWRQFEGLAGEFLTRAGFQIEMGPGRGDGGVDIRAWTESDSRNLPPAILVQAKRYKEDIDQTIVKALWADVVNENAASGLIVTTSKLAPAAENINVARSYGINQANRETIREWITKMRDPANRIIFLENT